MCGAATAVFSGLALAGVVYTVWAQREELSLQRQDLKLSRRQMVRQLEIQAEQLDVSISQQRPRLCFVGYSELKCDLTRDETWGEPAYLQLMLENRGGPIYSASCVILYHSGPLAEHYPGGQWEDCWLMPASATKTYVGADIPAGGKCFVEIYIRRYKKEPLTAIELSGHAQLILKYTNALNRSRVSVYEVVMTPESANFFLFEDLSPSEAQRKRLLDDWLGSGPQELTVETLNPEIFGFHGSPGLPP